VNFNEKQAVNLLLELRTDNPAGGAVGRIYLRTDLI
jgi:hypothetical protein